ncbi:MAG TPA: hypothetical protein VFK89_09670, partial [Actinomycetota bacterium]|nr:hypothetical protein [Actinomycetota bacterium]
AAEVWELRVPPATEIHVLARRVKHRVPPHVKARFTDKLPDLHRATVKGLPVASVERTLIALAAELPRLRAEIALDDALRRSLTSPRRIDACIAAISARGRRGTGIMRELLAPRMSNGIPESPLESKFYSALLSSDVPMPRLQFEVRVAGNLYRLDFAWPTKRVAVEMDGYAYHHGKVEWERDLARRNALTAIDWKLLHGRWDEDPYALLEKVRPLVT